MYTCTEVLILTVKLMCLFIKQIRDICLAKTNIVLQQWYTWFIFTVTIFNVWTPQTIYFGCITCISAMSTWHYAFHQKVDHNYFIGKTTAGPFLTQRQRIIGENVNVWNGRDIFTLLPNNQYYFFFQVKFFKVVRFLK